MFPQFMHSDSTTLNFPSILKCTHMGHCPILVCVNVYLSYLRAWTTLPIQIIWIKQSFELSSECQEPIGNKKKTVKASSIICSFKKQSIVKWNKLTEEINKVHNTFPFARAWRWWVMWPYISGETLHLPRGSLTAASKPEATNTNSGSNCKKTGPVCWSCSMECPPANQSFGLQVVMSWSLRV